MNVLTERNVWLQVSFAQLLDFASAPKYYPRSMRGLSWSWLLNGELDRSRMTTGVPLSIQKWGDTVTRTGLNVLWVTDEL
jgi:hypothetical protein